VRWFNILILRGSCVKANRLSSYFILYISI